MDAPSPTGKQTISFGAAHEAHRRVLFVTSELYPLAKVGGLGDVSSSLPAALNALGFDVRILLPAYAGVKERVGCSTPGPVISLPGVEAPAMLWQTHLQDSGVPVWLLDAPALFDRPGSPYADARNVEWPDNAARFLALARAAIEIADGRADPGWRPALLHGNDWPCGYVHVLAALSTDRLPSVFTVHNMAHPGLAPLQMLDEQSLPKRLGTTDALEFYGRLSALKGGLVFADRITTVSPSYAREIQTPDLGAGLDGVARQRAKDITGILNGVDYDVWDPRVDQYIAANYDRYRLYDKRHNKAALQRTVGLPLDEGVALLGFIGRLAHQKGIDLLLQLLAELAGRMQLVVLGTGDAHYESELRKAASHHGTVAVRVDQDEGLAHLIEAGADMLVMPSRFEPCGLNQLYSLRYGTIPVVHAVGGLRDSVTDTNEATLGAGTATGFVFDQPQPERLRDALDRALSCFANPSIWRRLQRTGMTQDFSWRRSALAYADVYRQALRSGAMREMARSAGAQRECRGSDGLHQT